MFFHLVSRTNGSGRRFTAYLSDTNTELITTWLVIRDNPKGLIELQGYNNEYKAYPPYSDEQENYYYLLRDLYGCCGSVNTRRIHLIATNKKITIIY
jgi:site-specific DNA-adenine methylase